MSRGTCEPAVQWRWQSGHHEQRSQERAPEDHLMPDMSQGLSHGTCKPAAQWRWQTGYHELRGESRPDPCARTVSESEL